MIIQKSNINGDQIKFELLILDTALFFTSSLCRAFRLPSAEHLWGAFLLASLKFTAMLLASAACSYISLIFLSLAQSLATLFSTEAPKGISKVTLKHYVPDALQRSEYGVLQLKVFTRVTCHEALPALRQRRIYSTHPALYFTCRLVVWVLTVHRALELSRALPKEDRCFQQHSHLLVTGGHFHLQSAVTIVLFTPAALYNALLAPSAACCIR